MKDANGRVLGQRFLRRRAAALSDEERQILAAVPDRSDDLMRFFGIGRTEQVGDNLQEALQYPSLNIRGLHSGDIGDQARTIIPDRATADIDVRLVKETDPERMLQRVLTHIRAQGFHVLMNVDPDDEMRARYPRIVRISRVELDQGVQDRDDAARIAALIRTLERVWGEPPVRNRTMGGTVPIDFFIQALGDAGDLRSGRQFRQQPAQQQRKPPATELVGCDRAPSQRSADVNPASGTSKIVDFGPCFDEFAISKFPHVFQFSGVTLRAVCLRKSADFYGQLAVTSRKIHHLHNIFSAGSSGLCG